MPTATEEEKGEVHQIKGLTMLKSVTEGSDRKTYEDFKDRIANHFMQHKIGGDDIASLIENDEDPTWQEPADLERQSVLEKKWYEKQVDLYFERRLKYERNKVALYSILWENISKTMQDLVRSLTGYQTAKKKKDPQWMLRSLHKVIVNFDDKKYIFIALDEQTKKVANFRQGDLTVEEFIKVFSQEWRTLKEQGGGIYNHGDAWDKELQKRYGAWMTERVIPDGETSETAIYLQEEKKNMLKAELEEEILSLAIFIRADKKRYGNLMIQYQNEYLAGTNKYPKNLTDLSKLLVKYQKEYPTSTTAGTTLLQSETQKKNGNVIVTKNCRDTRGRFFKDIVCKACGYTGHYISHCPMVDNQGTHLEGAGKGTANDLKRAERAAAARAKAAEDANTGDSNAGE